MIAVYYVDGSTPFGMYVLEVPGNGEHHEFLEALEKSEYPFPTSDVIILDGEKVIDQFDPYSFKQNMEVFKK